MSAKVSVVIKMIAQNRRSWQLSDSVHKKNVLQVILKCHYVQNAHAFTNCVWSYDNDNYLFALEASDPLQHHLEHNMIFKHVSYA